MQNEQMRLVDRTFVADVVVEDIGRIEKIGLDTYRILLCRIWRPAEGGEAEREIVASIVASGAVLSAMMAMFHGVTKHVDLVEVATLMQ
jgi:hypothetical protein